MLEISGNDIAILGDGDLRTLVARLAVAELRAKGKPRSSVTAGGNQDAADGGLDVRVDCPSDFVDPDFVPKRLTGFQVKRSDMPAGAISAEMRPKGVLRKVIRELADSSGAYVIVSSQGSVADQPLADRRQAIRAALHDLPSAANLHTDFYDRDRLATWVNEYPGIAAWVRSSIGRPLSGWSGIGDWGGSAHKPKPYLSNDRACLIDERSRDPEHLTIAEGITRLRTALHEPRQCIRLVGLSGLGKTRLVQALFEEEVGDGTLDSSLAVYTDYSGETNPTARDMARELIGRGQYAILVVDNCNPATHSELANLCASESSEISLITVEYDVRDDEPENTGVFRLQAASPEIVAEWLEQNFPEVSQIDRQKIAEFSDGNFRVALALAQTLEKGETLGRLKSRALFERIFHQRNQPDQQLLQAAENLSLLYSIDGEDVSEGSELAQVGALRGIGAQPLYEALEEMRQRGVVQARGRFRAILPQAIANPLAAQGIERIHPVHFDRFCAALTPRMVKSVSRRIGLLHDSSAAQALVARWLKEDGPLGDLSGMGEAGYQIIANIAPVSPDAVLTKFEEELEGPNGMLVTALGAPGRHHRVRMIKAIGYEAKLFDRAVSLLARFITAQPEENTNEPARNAFNEFFHLYLSGTKADPEQRRNAIRKFAASDNGEMRGCAFVALRALIKTDHFTSMNSFDFGARSRDWGWHPKINQDVWDWFEEAIELVVELAPESDARALLAAAFRGLWRYPGCREALERAATFFVGTRPWNDGWIAARASLRFDGKEMPEDVRIKLEQLIKRLKPADLLNQARAVVISRNPAGGWDIADGENDEEGVSKPWERANRMAQEIGIALAKDPAVRGEFIAELLEQRHAQRAYECGRGLAEGADDLSAIWLELVTAYEASEPKSRNATVLGGFICEAWQRDQGFTSRALDAVIGSPQLLPMLPYLQARIGVDVEGIERLRRIIGNGGLAASDLVGIANGSVSGSPAEPLAALLNDIAELPNGVGIALDILHMHFHRPHDEGLELNSMLVSIGRDLLARVDFGKRDYISDYDTGVLIRICFGGDSGREAAEKVCSGIRAAFESYNASAHDLRATLEAVFETQPHSALDALLLPNNAAQDIDLLEDDLDRTHPLEKIDPQVLKGWASRDPDLRYPLLGRCLNMFNSKDDGKEDELSPLFLSVLEQAPNKGRFLGGLWDRLMPNGWSGSLADILIRRRANLLILAESSGDEVLAWVSEAIPELDSWIERERGRDRVREESFE